MSRTIDERFINWSTDGELIQDEEHTPGESQYSLRHDAWSDLEIRTESGGSGTLLSEGDDYQIDAVRELKNAFGETIDVHTAVQVVNPSYQDQTLYHTYKAHADFQRAVNMVLARAGAPENYTKRGRWRIRDADTPQGRLTIVSPDAIEVEINGWGYWLPESVDIRVDEVDSWDNDDPTDYSQPGERAGKDFYLYACEPESGYVPKLVLSANSTYPDGYNADNSRKIGGFHCLCEDVGNDVYDYENEGDDEDRFNEVFVETEITNGDERHWLENYLEGDPIPFSIWDLEHRPVSNPEGTTYDPAADEWIDIYLPSYDSGSARLVSEYGGTIIAGEDTTPVMHQARFTQAFRRQKKKLPNHDGFVSLSLGSPQGVNIEGSSNPGTTGGHKATDGKRIVSLIGVEDAVGVFYQWGRQASSNDRSSWGSGFDGNDKNVEGEDFSDPRRPRFGGDWAGGSKCGSRGASWFSGALFLYSRFSARGVSEPSCRRA